MAWDVDLTARQQDDFNSLIIGRRLGAGQFRSVHEVLCREDLVLKIEHAGSTDFSNVKEWALWSLLWEFHRKAARWFAPCVSISPSGACLLMERTRPLVRGELPEKLPSFMTDVKPENLGMFGGRVVCHDYAWFHNIVADGVEKWSLMRTGWDKHTDPRDVADAEAAT